VRARAAQAGVLWMRPGAEGQLCDAAVPLLELYTRHMQRFGSDERGCFEGAEAGEGAGEWEAADGAEMGCFRATEQPCFRLKEGRVGDGR
jgi:hypothetical protein